LSVAAVNGLAAYTDLSPSKPETKITIQFTSDTLSPVTSGEIFVNANNSVAAAARPISTDTESVNVVNISPVIVGLAQMPDRNMQLTASGAPGATYSIQVGESLGSWTTIGTSVADENGTLVFLDQDATNYTVRFY